MCRRWATGLSGLLNPPANPKLESLLPYVRGQKSVVIAANAAIARLNAEAPTDAQQARPLDPAAELARYDEAARG